MTLSLVGADWPEDFDHWRSRRAALGFGDLPSDRFSVLNDGIGGLESLPEPGPVIAVICGTGAAVSARGPDGDHWHSSFWQRTQGSAELAEKALDAVYLADLGIGPKTFLTDLALKHFSVPDVTNLLHLFTTRRRHARVGIGDGPAIVEQQLTDRFLMRCAHLRPPLTSPPEGGAPARIPDP